MLSPRSRRLCQLLSSIVVADWDNVRRIRRSAPAGEPDRAWREAMLMVHLFAGVPRSIEAFDNLAEEGGVGKPEADEALLEPDLPDRGKVMFDKIYGRRADAIRAHLSGFHPDFGHWVAGHAYGRVLSRPGLDEETRELLAVAALSSLGQERQLAGHARGAVRCGADPNDVLAVLDELSSKVPDQHLERARTVVGRFVQL